MHATHGARRSCAAQPVSWRLPGSRDMCMDMGSCAKWVVVETLLRAPTDSHCRCAMHMHASHKPSSSGHSRGVKNPNLPHITLQARGEDVIPIPGTKNVKYLEENLGALKVKLSDADIAELEAAVPHEEVRLGRLGYNPRRIS